MKKIDSRLDRIRSNSRNWRPETLGLPEREEFALLETLGSDGYLENARDANRANLRRIQEERRLAPCHRAESREYARLFVEQVGRPIGRERG